MSGNCPCCVALVPCDDAVVLLQVAAAAQRRARTAAASARASARARAPAAIRRAPPRRLPLLKRRASARSNNSIDAERLGRRWESQ